MGKFLNSFKKSATSAIKSVKKAATKFTNKVTGKNRTNSAQRSGSVGNAAAQTVSATDNKLAKLEAKNKRLQLKSQKVGIKNDIKSKKIAGKRKNLQKAFDNQLKTSTLKQQPKYRFITGAVTTGVLGTSHLRNQNRKREMEALEAVTKDWAEVNISKNESKKDKK